MIGLQNDFHKRPTGRPPKSKHAKQEALQHKKKLLHLLKNCAEKAPGPLRQEAQAWYDEAEDVLHEQEVEINKL